MTASGSGSRCSTRPPASERRSATGHRDGIWAFTFSPDGTRLASGGEDGTARVWDAATGAIARHLSGAHEQGPQRRVSPGRRAPRDDLVGRDGAPVGRRDGPGGRSRRTTAIPARSSRPCTARTGNGSPRPAPTVPSGCGGRRAGRTWRSCTATPGGVSGLAFARSGRRLASLSRGTRLVTTGDDTVRVWDVNPAATLPVLRGHTQLRLPGGLQPGRPLDRLGGLGQHGALVGCGDRRAMRDLASPRRRAEPGLRPGRHGGW